MTVCLTKMYSGQYTTIQTSNIFKYIELPSYKNIKVIHFQEHCLFKTIISNHQIIAGD